MMAYRFQFDRRIVRLIGLYYADRMPSRAPRWRRSGILLCSS